MGWLKATAFVAIQRAVCLYLATLALPEKLRPYGLYGAILLFVLSVAENRLVDRLVHFLFQHLISILRISAKLMVMGAYIVGVTYLRFLVMPPHVHWIFELLFITVTIAPGQFLAQFLWPHLAEPSKNELAKD